LGKNVEIGQTKTALEAKLAIFIFWGDLRLKKCEKLPFLMLMLCGESNDDLVAK
jgi:hypothetical protein